MALNTQETAALKAAIAAETNATFAGYRAEGATGLMAEWYNGNFSPATRAWRTNVPPEDSDEAPSYLAFDTIQAGKRDSWRFFLQFPRNFTKNKVRRWVVDVWGDATQNSNAATILDVGTRRITRAENALGGTTTATQGVVTARVLTWEGPLTNEDVIDALR
jgi:hypothetical protein